jgi:CYTH domain-containing protein
MGVEIERKFLVRGRPWEGAPGRRLVQGYLAQQGGVVVRIRQDGARAILTIKGPSAGARRVEVEVDVPVDEGRQLLALCGPRVVAKTRHEVEHAGHTWEIDVFEGDNAGLVVAEIELDDEDEAFARPAWVADDVTDDPRYTNAALSERPYRTWSPTPAGT